MPEDQRRRRTRTWLALACIALAGCAQQPTTPRETPSAPPKPQRPEPPPAASAAPPAAPGAPASGEIESGWRQRGRISLYGDAFAGKRTASGDVFDPERLTMAHRTLPFGTRVRVTNLQNQRSVEVVVNDRGPFVPGRIADLSAAAAQQIGMAVGGVVDALLEVVEPSKPR